MDYSNLGDRAANAKDNLDADNKPPMENGEYKCVLRSGQFTKSRKGNDMFVLKMKVTDPDASERMAGETLLIRFVITPNTQHQLDRFLDLLNNWGVKGIGSLVKKDDDWEDLFIDLVAARPKAIVELEQSPSAPDEKGKIRMYYEFYFKEVIRCLNIDDLEGLETPAEEPIEEKPAPKKAEATPKKEEPKSEEPESTDDEW